MISKFLFPGYVCQKKIVEVKTLQYLDRILCTSTTGNMCFKVSFLYIPILIHFLQSAIVVRFLPLVIDHNHGYKSLPW